VRPDPDRLDWHGVAPLVSSGLQPVHSDSLPTDAVRRLQDSQHACVRRGLFLTGKLVRLLDLFGAAAIPVIPLKGPALSEYLYGDSALRQFVDLDLLVHRSDVPPAMLLLERQGYRLDSRLSWAPEKTLIALNC